jgi:hypothetical protein
LIKGMAANSFDNLGDVFEPMGQDMKEADARTKPWQVSINPGNYFVSNGHLGFEIYANDEGVYVELYQDQKEVINSLD